MGQLVHEDKIREDFLQFERLANVTGRGLAEALIECLGRHDLKMKFLRGQG